MRTSRAVIDPKSFSQSFGCPVLRRLTMGQLVQDRISLLACTGGTSGRRRRRFSRSQRRAAGETRCGLRGLPITLLGLLHTAYEVDQHDERNRHESRGTPTPRSAVNFFVPSPLSFLLLTAYNTRYRLIRYLTTALDHSDIRRHRHPPRPNTPGSSMTDARPLAFELPPLRAISVAIPLFILAVLLQPSVSARTSRRLRLALLVPTAVLGWISPFRWRIEPVEFAITANFRWGIFSPYFLMLALWFGAMGETERKNELAWLGFDGKAEKKALGVDEGSTGHGTAMKENGNAELRPRANGTLVAPKPRPVSPLASPALSLVSNSSLNDQLPTPSPSPPVGPVQPPSVVDAPPSSVNVPTLTSRKNATRSYSQRHHPLRILLDAAHLLSAMRMIGYAGGPRARDLPPAPKNDKTFLRDRLVAFYNAHLVSSACLALQVLDRDGVLASHLSHILPHDAAVFVSATLARLCIGVSLWVQMKIGFNGFAILFYLLHRGTNAFLDTLQAVLPRRWSEDLTWRSTFDVREYPALFDSPFSKMGEGGVTKFWSARWHFLFRAT